MSEILSSHQQKANPRRGSWKAKCKAEREKLLSVVEPERGSEGGGE